MTFLELQNEMLPAGIGLIARFSDTQRASVKRWINARYAEVWGLEEWTFRKAYANVTVTGGSNVAAVPTDFGIGRGLWNDLGDELVYVRPREYFARHLGPAVNAIPSIYTVVNRQLLLDPTPGASSSAWVAFYDKKLVLLANDADVPAIPEEHHHMLVHGGEASGQVRMQDFTYQFSQQEWLNQIEAMRANYLVDVRGAGHQWPAYNPW